MSWKHKDRNHPLYADLPEVYCRYGDSPPEDWEPYHEPHDYFEEMPNLIQIEGNVVTRTQQIRWFWCDGRRPDGPR